VTEVVCIKKGPWFDIFGFPHTGAAPAYNQVCTVSGHHEFLGFKFYHLVGFEASWDAAFFKPLKKTDISCFTGMLKTKSNELEDA
jgi:hypothetical protein